MTDYFQEMGWSEVDEGDRPNDGLLHMARFLIDIGFFDNNDEEWPSLPPPASKEAVKNLPEILVDSEGRDCPICLKIFGINDKAKEMPCHHIFHSSCILTWLKQTNSCPFCRHELPTDDEEYEAFKEDKKNKENGRRVLEAFHNATMFT